MKPATLMLLFTVLCIGGWIVFPVWPLLTAPLFLLIFSNQVVVAVVYGFVLDLLWGAPTGAAHFLLFPYTLLALVVGITYRWGGRYMRQKGSSYL